MASHSPPPQTPAPVNTTPASMGSATPATPPATPISAAAGQPPTSPALAAAGPLWRAAGLPAAALTFADLPGAGPVLPSSFDVATAAQASLGLAVLAAAEIGHLRGIGRQSISVDRAHAALECTTWFALDGVTPPMWDPLSGLYPCGGPGGPAGWVRIHANFAHHRDGALRLLGLAPGPATPRNAVAQALATWTAEGFEQAAADAGLVVAATRSFAQWDAHPQALALGRRPPLSITAIETGSAPAPAQAWPRITPAQSPLSGLRVLDLTRILAGPVAGQCLAAYGAEVMLVNGPHLPNIDAIAATSRGKLSAQIDLRQASGQAQLLALLGSAQVFMQGYRPGALAARGLDPRRLAQWRPGIVVGSLSAYGGVGPWAERRGFDSLVQTATGFNLAEAEAAGSTDPKALPMQILDYSAGHLLAFGIQAALWRQATQGGSWLVQVSLVDVGHWLRSLGRLPDGLAAIAPSKQPYLADSPCGFGAEGHATLRAMRHAARFSRTPTATLRPSMPPGSHQPVWPGT